MFKSIIIVISLGGQFRYLKLKYFQEKKIIISLNSSNELFSKYLKK